ncbi:MAG: XrtA/PEP-CTERM system histidine kinase PrsK [Limisphaerales bacterium]
MDLAVILAYAGAVLAGALAFGVAWNQRRSIVHWSFVAGMVALAAESAFFGLAADSGFPERIVFWQKWRLFALSFLPGTWLFFSLSYARGNYRDFIARWRLGLAAAFLLPVLLAVWFREDLIASAAKTESGRFVCGLGLSGYALILLFLLSAVLVLMNLECTYRASMGTMRWRIKFMVLGLGLLFVVRACSSSQVLVLRGLNLSLQTINSCALLVACLLILGSLSRAGHFQVNVYPSHSVLSNSLTLMLAGLYFLIVGVLAKVLSFFGSNVAFELKAFLVLISLVLLASLLLSDRIRLLAKRFVSRHFQRPQYDYRTVWRTFTEGIARRVEPPDLCAAVAKLVSEVFQALSVTVWLVDDRKENLAFAASTSLSEAQGALLRLDAADAASVITALTAQAEPTDLDSSKEIWAVLLRRLHPDSFRKGGNRIGVPLIAAGELMGVMILGDRVAGVPYSLQDFDLLKSVGDQAAASLLNIQLSQRLSQAKQFEAFQAMSAFFVHDLKNTASTLSLTLQNLPLHFNDPNFREDALRGISKTVAHINDLISRLSVLRQEFVIQPVESDLNEVVTAALNGQPRAPGLNLAKELRPLPKVRLDPAQIQKVVTNLVLNASEAVGADGQIRVETSQRNGCVVLAVADNGCGMSADFIQHSLFRPFQTTKKKGLGIGMFQCKMIVEAHQGRIEVESQPGKGATFRVLLPSPPLEERDRERRPSI